MRSGAGDGRYGYGMDMGGNALFLVVVMMVMVVVVVVVMVVVLVSQVLLHGLHHKQVHLTWRYCGPQTRVYFSALRKPLPRPSCRDLPCRPMQTDFLSLERTEYMYLPLSRHPPHLRLPAPTCLSCKLRVCDTTLVRLPTDGTIQLPPVARPPHHEANVPGSSNHSPP
jgi:hypothetical protein